MCTYCSQYTLSIKNTFATGLFLAIDTPITAILISARFVGLTKVPGYPQTSTSSSLSIPTHDIYLTSIQSLLLHKEPPGLPSSQQPLRILFGLTGYVQYSAIRDKHTERAAKRLIQPHLLDLRVYKSCISGLYDREGGGDRNNTLSWLMFFGCGDDDVFLGRILTLMRGMSAVIEDSGDRGKG